MTWKQDRIVSMACLHPRCGSSCSWLLHPHPTSLDGGPIPSSCLPLVQPRRLCCRRIDLRHHRLTSSSCPPALDEFSSKNWLAHRVPVDSASACGLCLLSFGWPGPPSRHHHLFLLGPAACHHQRWVAIPQRTLELPDPWAIASVMWGCMRSCHSGSEPWGPHYPLPKLHSNCPCPP